MNKEEYEDSKLNTRVVLIGLWNVLVLLYIYADIFSLMRADYLKAILYETGLVTVDQTTLVLASILMLIPILMIVANLFLKLNLIRWLNIIVAIVYTLVNIGNIFLEPGWIYYSLISVVEILITVLIIVTAYKWPKKTYMN